MRVSGAAQRRLPGWVRRLSSGALIALVAVSAGPMAVPAHGEASTGSPDEITSFLVTQYPGQILQFSLDEARGLGYPVDPPSGLPVCELDPTFEGYDTADEAIAAAEAASTKPECALVPRAMSVVVGAPEPSGDHSQGAYHHNGQQTNRDNFQGGRGAFKVKDVTDLGHPGSGTQFLVDRILVKKTASPTSCQKPTDTVRWGEVGWSEVSWKANDRYVYTWGTQDCAWRFYEDLSLTDGSFYAFRARHVNGDLRTAILWGGTWTVLHDYNGPDCVSGPGEAVCFVEDYVEIYSQVVGNHPDWNGTIGNEGLQLQRSSGDWDPWGSGVDTTTGYVDPYVYCIVSRYDSFTVQKGGSC